MFLDRFEEALEAYGSLSSRRYSDAAFMAGCHARLGDLSRAKDYVIECINLKPDFWMQGYMAKEPLKNTAVAIRLIESLSMAGLPR